MVWMANGHATSSSPTLCLNSHNTNVIMLPTSPIRSCVAYDPLNDSNFRSIFPRFTDITVYTCSELPLIPYPMPWISQRSLKVTHCGGNRKLMYFMYGHCNFRSVFSAVRDISGFVRREARATFFHYPTPVPVCFLWSRFMMLGSADWKCHVDPVKQYRNKTRNNLLCHHITQDSEYCHDNERTECSSDSDRSTKSGIQ